MLGKRPEGLFPKTKCNCIYMDKKIKDKIFDNKVRKISNKCN